MNHIDEIARKALKDYHKKSDKKVWKTLKHQLDARNTILLADRIEQQNKPIIPIRSLVHKPWFKVAMAACFMLLIMFSYAIIKQWTSNKTQKDKNVFTINQQTPTQNILKDTIGDKEFPVQIDSDNPTLTDNIDITPGQDMLNNNTALNNQVTEQTEKLPIDRQQLHESSSINNADITINNNMNLANNTPNAPGYSKSLHDEASVANDPVTTKNDQEPNPGEKNNERIKESDNQHYIDLPNEGIIDTDKQRIKTKDQQALPTYEESTENISIVIPNVITPNNDGFNDFFVIKNLDHYSTSQLVIINRNGKILFEKTNYQNDWNAEGLEDGVYYYLLVYKDSDNNNITKRGAIQILRK
ncbi:gliding motility-associated C-terminal domain-containing protein [candidate division KSB1 bacterium]